MGLLFLLGEIWELFSVQAALVPVFVITAGIVLILSALASGSVVKH